MSDPVAATKKSSEINIHGDTSMVKERKRKLGRKGRRRRKRIAEIKAAAAVAAHQEASDETTGNNLLPQQSAATILPQDRDHQWPAVGELCSLEDSDKKSLIAQLGYYPGNALSVVARANQAFPGTIFKDDTGPLVLKLYPLVIRDESDGTSSRRKRKLEEDKTLSGKVEEAESSKKNHLVEPFPTIFWVTHPRLRALISKIEIENRGIQYEKRLQQDTKELQSMKQAHLAYGNERFSMITAQDRVYIEKRRWNSALDSSRGVAGIRNYAAIKCLHAHAAHFWSGCQENVVGKWVSEEVMSLLQEK